MRRTQWAALLIAFVLAVAALVAGVAWFFSPKESAVRLRASSQLRGVLQACVTYAQDHGGEWPDAANWKKTLVDANLLSPEVFEHPRARRGVEPWIPVYQYAPDAERARWSNNFQETVPVFIENPELWDGKGANVAYNDNHVQWEDGVAVRNLLEELRAGTWRPETQSSSFGGSTGPSK